MEPNRVGSEILDRLPPSSLEAERGVLGSILLDPRAFDEVSLIVRADDFYSAANSDLFTEVETMIEKRIPIDGLMLRDRLQRTGKMESIGGEAYLGEVLQSTFTASYAAHYARIVSEKAKLRKIIQSATDALRDAYADTGKADEIAADLERDMGAVMDSRESTVVYSLEIAANLSDRIDEICEKKNHLGLQTGFEGLDQITGGLFNSELIILAARPGKGKSSLGTQIIANIAREGKLAYVVSLEMPPEDIAQRIVCESAEVNSKQIRTGRIDLQSRSRLSEGIAQFSRLPIYWETRDSINVARIRQTAKTLVKKGLRIILVDYVGLMECNTGDEKRSEWERQSNISKGMKKLAAELKIPVVCICQLNREIDEQDRPQPKHLRGSGSWEQDAHMILFIHRPDGGIIVKEKGKPDAKMSWDAELIIAKNRNGEAGTVRLFWTPEYTRYSSWGVQRRTYSDSANRETAFDDYSGDNDEF